MELYADAVQHLYEEMKLEKQAPDTPRRVVWAVVMLDYQ